MGRLGHDKVVALAVAGIILGASVASVSAAAPSGPGGPVGGTTGGGDAARLAVGGDAGLDETGAYDDTYPAESTVPVTLFSRVTPIDLRSADLSGDDTVALLLAANTPVSDTGVSGPFLDDGTLLKPVAVDTTVEDGRGLLKKYRVKGGDTLTGIASRFDVSMMTLYWANDLKAKDELHLGQVLLIPPVSGLVVTVTPDDTLDSLAAKFKVKKSRIISTNNLTDPNLVVGQVLIVPGAKGKAIPAPKPVKKPAVSRPRPSGGGGGRSVRPPTHYNGGHFVWPVVGGGNYISQYYHYGHYADRHRRRLRLHGPRGRRRHGDLRRLEEQRRRVSGVDRPRLEPLHDLQPHVLDHRRPRPARGSRPAGRPRRPIRQRDGSAPPLRGLDRPGLERRTARQPARLPLVHTDRRPPGTTRRTVRGWPRCSSTA